MAESLLIYAGLFAVLSALGTAIDVWMTDKDKKGAYKTLNQWWQRVDDGAMSEYPQRAAEWFLKQEQKIFGISQPVRLIAISALLSIALTTLAILFAEVYLRDNSLSDAWYQLITANTGAFGIVGDSELETIYVIAGYLINVLFDVITLYITVVLLRFAIAQSWPTALLLFAADGFIAVLLAIACGAASYYFLVSEELSAWIPGDYYPLGTYSMLDSIEASGRDLLAFFVTLTGGEADPAAIVDSTPAYSATSLIPSMFYISALVLLTLAKPIAHFLGPLTAAMIHRLVQHDPNQEPDRFKPGVMIGTLFGLAGALFGVVSQIFKTMTTQG